MSFLEVLGTIVDLLLGGLTNMAAGIGEGLGALAEKIFLVVTEDGTITGLSTFGGLICIFAGIALAIGLSRWVLNWLTGFGR